MSKFFDFKDDDNGSFKPTIKSKTVANSYNPNKEFSTTYDRDKVFNQPGHQFKYGGKVYECIGEDKDFQITQFRFITEVADWVTMRNRITNQTRFGPNIKEIK